MSKRKTVFFIIGLTLAMPTVPGYAQQRLGALKLEEVKPQAGNGQEIIYKDENKQEIKVEYGRLSVFGGLRVRRDQRTTSADSARSQRNAAW